MGKATKNSKAKKDPNAPKKPLSAFFLFSAERRPEIKKGEAKVSASEVAKMIGKEWGELTEDQKKPYQTKAARDKEAYQKKVKANKEKEG